MVDWVLKVRTLTLSLWILSYKPPAEPGLEFLRLEAQKEKVAENKIM